MSEHHCDADLLNEISQLKGQLHETNKKYNLIKKLYRKDKINFQEEIDGSKLLQDISIELLYEENIQEFYEKIMDTTIKIMCSQFASIQMLYPEGVHSGEIKLLAYRGFNKKAAKFWEWVNIDSSSSCGAALREHKRIIINNVETFENIQDTEDREMYLQTGIYSVQTTPLVTRTDKLVGMLSSHWDKPYEPTERQLRFLDVLARQAADLIEWKLSIEKLEKSEKHALNLVKQLEINDKNKDRFLNMLSHELRNPLAAINMSIQLIEYTEDNFQKAKARNIIKQQVKQLNRLVDDLVDITRINNNKMEIKKEKIDLRKILLETVEAYKSLYEKKEIKLNVRINTGSVFIDADIVRLKQVVGNLLHNAMKFTHSNGAVTVYLNLENNEAVIKIVDTGVGIKPELLKEVFNSFVQADNSIDRSYGGLGLGLAIVKELVKLHGGSVEAFSEGANKGSQFIIKLPLVVENKKVTGKINNQEKFKLDGLNVLIIDDNKDLAEIMSELLAMLGHSTEIAFNANDGIAKAKELMPDAIICDIGLPVKNGYEVAKSIKQDTNLERIFMIALSGYNQLKDIQLAKEAGFDKYLSKPVDVTTLERVLNELTNKKSYIF